MKSFYSLVSYCPNPIVGEKIVIGIILFNDGLFSFSISEHKKSIAKKLLNNSWDLIEAVEKQMQLKIKQLNTQELLNSGQLFISESILKDSYFDYLSKYSNGIIQFSPPSIINDEIDQDKSKKLFQLLVDNIGTDKLVIRTDLEKEIEFNVNINTKLIDRVKTRVHTNVKIDNTVLPSILSQVDMNCIGKNGSFVGAKSLLIHSKPAIKNNIEAFINMIVHISLKYKTDITKNKFFLISDEPNNIGSQEHSIWEKLQKETLFQVIPSEQADLVADQIEKSNATTFL